MGWWDNYPARSCEGEPPWREVVWPAMQASPDLAGDWINALAASHGWQGPPLSSVTGTPRAEEAPYMQRLVTASVGGDFGCQLVPGSLQEVAARFMWAAIDRLLEVDEPTMESPYNPPDVPHPSTQPPPRRPTIPNPGLPGPDPEELELVYGLDRPAMNIALAGGLLAAVLLLTGPKRRRR